MNQETPSLKKSRKQYLVHPQFQLQFIAWMLALALLSLILMYCSHLIFLGKLVAIGKTLQLPVDHSFFSFVKAQEHILLQNFAWTALGIVLIIGTGGLLISHRITGPIARIEEHIDDVLKNNSSEELRFRRRDFFPELAEQVNLLIRRIHGK